MDTVDIATSKTSLSPSQDTQRRLTAPSPRSVERPGAVDPGGEPVVVGGVPVVAGGVPVTPSTAAALGSVY